MVIELGSHLTIANAAEVKQAVLGGLAKSEALSLDATALEELDVAGIQLLCATHRLAVAKGKTVTLLGGASPALATAVAAGFGPGRGCAPDCLCVGVRP